MHQACGHGAGDRDGLLLWIHALVTFIETISRLGHRAITVTLHQCSESEWWTKLMVRAA